MGKNENIKTCQNKFLKNCDLYLKEFIMQRHNQKKKLSKCVLEMKFMKRTKEKVEIEEENQEREDMYASSISDAMKFQGSRFIAEPSYVNIENLTFGRLAFHGMNPEIEKMAEEVRLKVEEAESIKKEKDVQDAEMADFYSSMNSTVAKKFSTKRNFNGNKLTPPASGSSTSDPKSMNDPEAPDTKDILTKGHNYVQGMQQQNKKWYKNQKDVKRQKMQKPSTD